MKKIFLFSALLLQQFSLLAQHCPWDCSGMILVETNVSKTVVSKLHPVLIDENKKEVNDTIYGAEKETYDPCIFLFYDDFKAYRTKRIKAHESYHRDTVYYFAEGLFMVKYNYCNYDEKKLYLRFLDRHAKEQTFHYIEIPDSMRIHLHDYNDELKMGERDVIIQNIHPPVLKLNCEALFLRKEECK